MSEQSSSKRPPVGSWIVLGLLLGTVLGLVLDDFGFWVAMGLLFGSIAEGVVAARRRREPRADR